MTYFLQFWNPLHISETVKVGIAIPGSRDSRIPGSRKFSNPEIPGLNRTQSRDFGINKIYLFNGLFSTF